MNECRGWVVNPSPQGLALPCKKAVGWPDIEALPSRSFTLIILLTQYFGIGKTKSSATPARGKVGLRPEPMSCSLDRGEVEIRTTVADIILLTADKA